MSTEQFSEDKPKLTDDQLRCKQAASEIRVILDAYDAELFPVMMISPKGILGTTIDIVPKQKQQTTGEPVNDIPRADTCECESEECDPAGEPCDGHVPENKSAKVIALKSLEEALTDQVSPDKA